MLNLKAAQRPLIMGIVNVTPDSFSDGGKFQEADKAIAHGLKLLANGADILDIGGESTRPGSDPVSDEEELARVIPVIEGLKAQAECKISIDTMKSSVAKAAIKAGADIWNDVSALRFNDDSAKTAAELNCPIILMHMLGQPKTMQADPQYDNVVDEVSRFLKSQATIAIDARVKPENIIIDPGIGFGKTLDHNIQLMQNLDKIVEETGYPLLFGASRKRFIAGIDSSNPNEDERLGGSIAVALHAAAQGAKIIRVHDVYETRQALLVANAINQ